MPNFKSPPHYVRSPLQSTPSKPRDIFFFFKGGAGHQPGASGDIVSVYACDSPTSKLNIVRTCPPQMLASTGCRTTAVASARRCA